MAGINYKQICTQLLSPLAAKQREVIERRFGLKTGKRETLEAIGKTHKICRERVRQIEKAAFVKMKKSASLCREPARVFAKYLKNSGGAREESAFLRQAGGKDFSPHVYFLMIFCGDFIRVKESDDTLAFWAQDKQSVEAVKTFIAAAAERLEESKKLASSRGLSAILGLKKAVAESYLEVSKRVQKNKDGLYGLREWPEVNPKGIKDKIYLLLKESKNPLHFSDVARGIEGSLVQTVHNELIRDPRFVLIGRGLYALKDWGYVAGDVKDVILNIFGNEGRPLSKQEILDRVMRQRHIKENTVLMNLGNKNYFSRGEDGLYRRADVQEA